MLFRVTEIRPSPQVFLVNVDFPKMKAGTNTWISQGCFCCGPTVCQVWPTCGVLLWVCMEWAQPQGQVGALTGIYAGFQVTFLED